ncbi:hypothetical protein H634G_11605 [Metarhizium anisopliae BRIP 53293]|uniref:Uncharacterized protein n=1 Tax=Metarhizium anisopliae BRIP 53293 TaxID=1291518 RepID=A0A0D9NKZ3_METAN|nr:hypothetical protein H634G_11605 [Metarhizium anisopliae BRIP 53293]
MENTQIVNCLERHGNNAADVRFHGPVNTVKDRLSSPAEEHEAYRDILPLDGLESVIHIILVLQAGKV